MKTVIGPVLDELGQAQARTVDRRGQLRTRRTTSATRALCWFA
jgi:hypothetical protein